jgi:hypothetical protein
VLRRLGAEGRHSVGVAGDGVIGEVGFTLTILRCSAKVNARNSSDGYDPLSLGL